MSISLAKSLTFIFWRCRVMVSSAEFDVDRIRLNSSLVVETPAPSATKFEVSLSDAYNEKQVQ